MGSPRVGNLWLVYLASHKVMDIYARRGMRRYWWLGSERRSHWRGAILSALGRGHVLLRSKPWIPQDLIYIARRQAYSHDPPAVTRSSASFRAPNHIVGRDQTTILDI
jgi:hypothetical protein